MGGYWERGTMKGIVWGTIPAGAQPVHEAIAIEDPAEYTARLFRELLVRRGIKVAGKAYARHDEIAKFFDPPAPAVAVAEVQTETRLAPHPSIVLPEHVSIPLLQNPPLITTPISN